MSDFNIKSLLKEIVVRRPKNAVELEKIKREFARKKKLPIYSNWQLKFFLKEKIFSTSEQKFLEKLLAIKKIRALSGVVVVAVLTKPYPCPGKCLYCPSEKNMPKSYLSNEPAVMRAIGSAFHPYLQVQNRLKMLRQNGHRTCKIELIVMGGTFSYFPYRYQKWFIRECFRAANDFPFSKKILSSKSFLKQEQKKNETAENRIIGLTLETRPDYITSEEVAKFRHLGATRVELGVQTVFNSILKKNRRGHNVQAIVSATRLLKEAGFKVGYHLMPGLLGSSQQKDLQVFQKLFSSSDFQPDLIKIYPCVVTAQTELEKKWRSKIYRPYTNQQIKELLIKIKKIIPPYVRISRLIRDIPEESILAGPNISNLRQILQQEKVSCRCIRCREVRDAFLPQEKIILDRFDYLASRGKEIFLQFTNFQKNKLFALLRLRINSVSALKNPILPVLKDCALIREVHTYGHLLDLGEKNSIIPQHQGLGKKLLAEAERIVQEEFGLKKIAVISGIGARKYYEKLGYFQKDDYMIKELKNSVGRERFELP